ncbi:DUF7089 family protein [Halovivax gelatinilyticus]|uniref:DUF7089 family protein n=1 Tax=Halovivax gelatinilyticus TaxID=2961597 RepID=UPI0020CA75B3|nr:hypothetical protein [Halovivax gelatinilyticus]
MFESRTLSGEVASVRSERAPEAMVFDCERDFETVPPAAAENLGLVVDRLDPHSYPSAWLPDDSPRLLAQYASETFTIGMPGDGSVVWTRQTEPPVVLVKPRLRGSPPDFVDFLLAAAFVELSLDVPEHFLGFFESRYRDLDAALEVGPAATYQIAAALYDGWIGLQTRPVFDGWSESHPALWDSWVDAGERLEGRIGDLPAAVARGETSFAAATELACSAIKHDLALPAPFDALDTAAYRDHGVDFAVQWADRIGRSLGESDA